MKTTRREFGILGGLAAATTLFPGSALTKAATAVGKGEFAPNAWHQRIKRVMQINFTEHDAENFDVDAWIAYVEAVKAECTFVSVTNMVAFYPTALEGYPRSRWLKDRDIFGECAAAAKKRGIRVLGRLSLDTARIETADKHPDWFRRSPDGTIVPAITAFARGNGDPSASAEYGRTCQFSSYFSDFAPQLIDEVMTRFMIDGVYTNGWPNDSVPLCYCPTCRKIGDPKSETYRIAYQNRAIELWAIYNKTVRLRNKEAIFSGNLGGGIKGGELDLKELASKAVWMFADNQGRSEDFGPSWETSQQTRVARALQPSRPAMVSTASWTYISTAAWRTVTGNADEVRSRLFQTLAAGGTMHLHWLGFDQGFHEDRRWQEVGIDVLGWQAANNAHFYNVRSLANVALVISPRTNRLYEAPAGTDGIEPFQGMYKVLNEARIPFDLVLDSELSSKNISQYSVLILPNVALLDDVQVAHIRDFVRRGGSILSTFETGLYDHEGKPRADFALAELFDMHKTGARIGYGADGTAKARRLPGAVSMQRIEQPHPVIAGFHDTNWIHGSSWRVPLTAAGKPVLTNIPQHPVYPVEAVFPSQPHTDVPTIVIRERGNARLVHLAGDIDGGYWRSSAADLGDLITGALGWLTRGQMPLKVEGDGLVEVTGWQTEPGYAVHLVNHTNPNFRGGALRNTYPLGPQKVVMQLGATTPIREARLLRAGAALPFRQNGGTVEFTLPGLRDYEMVALTV
ncbi:beta-galactosidase trimerization domain-containing protein [Sphingobium sp. H39-3-25]|uniref:beta-galactosidase trimerization domain-containing protein n=1 Tax=Sphingobium arseniciresistens TaxID=3030834 RepID=UPI0023B98C7B|nr:beta-galactosidase trimerization domain-containing protein [Sphingobium arseniciresistens]